MQVQSVHFAKQSVPSTSSKACAVSEALKELEYPVKLQKLLLTPQREVLVELVITKDRCTTAA